MILLKQLNGSFHSIPQEIPNEYYEKFNSWVRKLLWGRRKNNVALALPVFTLFVSLLI